MKRSDFRYLERLRVRWAEVDMQKVVFNGHYLMYFDTAVSGYWRALAMPYEAMLHHLKGDLYVRKASLEYQGSARYDDVCEIGMRCTRVGNSSMVLGAALFRGEELLVHGELVYVFTELHVARSQPIPPELRAIIDAFEAGQPMVDVRVGTWDELGREAQALRTQVFVDEQGIAPELEWDAADASALHAVAYNRLGMPLATGRLLEFAPGVAKVGRMAVTRALRGSGVGRQVLEALAAAARQRGDRQLRLHAQTTAAGFYARAGFVTDGPPFDEAGLAHVAMTRPL